MINSKHLQGFSPANVTKLYWNLFKLDEVFKFYVYDKIGKLFFKDVASLIFFK